MRKDTSVQEKEKDLHWVLFSGDESMIAIRTPRLVKMCINTGLNIVKKSHELQHGDCTNSESTNITVNGTITTREEAAVYVKDVDMLITVQL